jgi:hypothetical protein
MTIAMSLVTLFVGLALGFVSTRAFGRVLDRTGARDVLGWFLSALPGALVYFWVVWISLSNYLETLPHVYFKAAPLLRFVEEGAIPLTITLLAMPLLALLAANLRRAGGSEDP